MSVSLPTGASLFQYHAIGHMWSSLSCLVAVLCSRVFLSALFWLMFGFAFCAVLRYLPHSPGQPPLFVTRYLADCQCALPCCLCSALHRTVLTATQSTWLAAFAGLLSRTRRPVHWQSPRAIELLQSTFSACCLLVCRVLLRPCLVRFSTHALTRSMRQLEGFAPHAPPSAPFALRLIRCSVWLFCCPASLSRSHACSDQVWA